MRYVARLEHTSSCLSFHWSRTDLPGKRTGSSGANASLTSVNSQPSSTDHGALLHNVNKLRACSRCTYNSSWWFVSCSERERERSPRDGYKSGHGGGYGRERRERARERERESPHAYDRYGRPLERYGRRRRYAYLLSMAQLLGTEIEMQNYSKIQFHSIHTSLSSASGGLSNFDDRKSVICNLPWHGTNLVRASILICSYPCPFPRLCNSQLANLNCLTETSWSLAQPWRPPERFQSRVAPLKLNTAFCSQKILSMVQRTAAMHTSWLLDIDRISLCCSRSPAYRRSYSPDRGRGSPDYNWSFQAKKTRWVPLFTSRGLIHSTQVFHLFEPYLPYFLQKAPYFLVVMSIVSKDFQETCKAICGHTPPPTCCD